VLIADDETHILNVLTIKLRNAGFRVLNAEDGEDALALARSEQPDLLITDYQMPLLSGVELCAKMRNHPATKDIPVILLTARGFAVSEQDMRAGNIRRVLAKPFSPREILACAHELLNHQLNAVCRG
jgi:DNA-binding response OmpR family regulator